MSFDFITYVTPRQRNCYKGIRSPLNDYNFFRLASGMGNITLICIIGAKYQIVLNSARVDTIIVNPALLHTKLRNNWIRVSWTSEFLEFSHAEEAECSYLYKHVMVFFQGNAREFSLKPINWYKFSLLIVFGRFCDLCCLVVFLTTVLVCC